MFNSLLKLLVIYFVLIVVFRILGKREVGELSIFDLVILLIIADIASIGIDNNKFFYTSLVLVFSLVLLQKILSVMVLKIPKMRRLVDGAPRIIVINGMIDYRAMKKELYTIDDLITQMHEHHIMDISEIRLGVLETNGTLSIFRTSRFDEVIIPVITSGIFQNDGLMESKFSELYIKNALRKNNLDYKKVLYATICGDVLKYYYHEKGTRMISLRELSL